jgi:hypothetical protein
MTVLRGHDKEGVPTPHVQRTLCHGLRPLPVPRAMRRMLARLFALLVFAAIMAWAAASGMVAGLLLCLWFVTDVLNR